MKKIFCAFLFFLVLCGCSTGETTQSCDWCENQVPLKTVVSENVESYICETCFNELRQESYDDGYRNGYESGHDDGYKTGYSEGNAKGRTKGYNAGYVAGKNSYYWTPSSESDLSDSLSATLEKMKTNSDGNYSSIVQAQNKVQEITVYITNTGEKYHMSACQYLRNSKIAISKSTAISRGYTACSVCW